MLGKAPIAAGAISTSRPAQGYEPDITASPPQWFVVLSRGYLSR